MNVKNQTNDKQGAGYGQPPKAGQSGNPNGRPKKPKPSVVDLDAILLGEIPVNGVPVDSRELELRQQVNKALEPKGALKSMRHVLDEFERHGAIEKPKPKDKRVELPSVTDVPWGVQSILLKSGAVPPWTTKQLSWAKATYLASRNEGDRRFDVAAGYEEWLLS
jgi:hypothetical protein